VEQLAAMAATVEQPQLQARRLPALMSLARLHTRVAGPVLELALLVRRELAAVVLRQFLVMERQGLRILAVVAAGLGLRDQPSAVMAVQES
jgi:hypothetical protein